MRVLALSGNSDRSESALLAGLARKGVQVHFIGTPGAIPLFNLEGANIPLHFHDCRSRLDFKAIRLLKNELSAGKFDLIHAFTSRMLSNAILASLGSQVKLIAYRGTSGHLSRFDPAAWLSYLNPKVAAISCVSEGVKDYLKSCGIRETKLFTIYKGHEISWYQPAGRTGLREFGVPQSAFVVACVANMRPVKGVDVLIRAAHLLPQKYAIHFLLIGELRDKRLEKLIAAGEAANRIHLTGYRKDAAALAGASSIFVMPSREREGLPKAVIEAMSQAVPPVVTAVGGMKELVRHEVDGLVVPPADAPALANAIERLYTDTTLRLRLAEQACQRIASDFTVEQTVAKTLALYESVCCGKTA